MGAEAGTRISQEARTDVVVAGCGVGKEMETNGWIWYLLWRRSQQDLLRDWSLKSWIEDGFWVWGLNKWTWSQKYIISLKLHEDPPETRLTAGKPGWEEFVVHACS